MSNLITINPILDILVLIYCKVQNLSLALLCQIKMKQTGVDND